MTKKRQEKSEVLIVRVSKGFKDQVEARAMEQDVAVAELIRKTLRAQLKIPTTA